jgi:RNA polymerase sigma-70 factor (ECF subfamily)
MAGGKIGRSLNDEHLASALEAAMRGDEAGFAALWRALQPALLRYLRVVAGDAAEDVASETWLQTVRDLRGFSGDVHAFRVWLFRVARNRGVDEQRRVGRRREDLASDVDQPGVVTAPDAASQAIERTETDWALRMVSSLPRDQAEAVMLRVVAGLDVAQTAQVLGKRAGAVRIAAMRGLRRLAAHEEVLARQQGRTRPESARRAIDPPRPEVV